MELLICTNNAQKSRKISKRSKQRKKKKVSDLRGDADKDDEKEAFDAGGECRGEHGEGVVGGAAGMVGEPSEKEHISDADDDLQDISVGVMVDAEVIVDQKLGKGTSPDPQKGEGHVQEDQASHGHRWRRKRWSELKRSESSVLRLALSFLKKKGIFLMVYITNFH